MISGIQGQVQGQMGRRGAATPGAAPGAAGLAGLGDRIQQTVQGRMGGVGQPAGLPQAGGVNMGNLGSDIQARVQAGLAKNPAGAAIRQPNIPNIGGGGMTPPTGPTPGPAPGNPSGPGGPPTGVPSTGGTLGAPTGTIPRGNITGGGSWENVNQYDAQISAAAAKHGVDPAMLKAMMIIESGGDPGAAGAGGAIGLMQVKPEYWQDEALSMGYDLYTPEGQIGMAAAILGGDVGATRGMSPEEAFVSVYYPTECLDCPGESGHTPRMYLDDMAMYMDIINGAAPANGSASGNPGGGVGNIPQQSPYPTGDGGVVSPPGSSTASDSGVVDPRGLEIAQLADDYVGVPYPTSGGWGDNASPENGWDCSGMTYWLAKQYGYHVPAGSHYQYDAAVKQGILRDASTMQPGDIIFFDTGFRDGGGAWLNGASHVGVYLGDGKFINSAAPGIGTVIYDLDSYGYEPMGVASMYDYQPGYVPPV